MSTPISRNNKLEGPALYAPLRVRERIFFPDQAATVETPAQSDPEQPETEQIEAAESETEQSETEQPETEQSEAEQSEYEETAAVEEADCGNEADDADALDWVDQAIRAVIEIEHASSGLPTPAPRSAAPRSPSGAPRSPATASVRAPARDDSEAWERPSSAAQRQDRDDARYRGDVRRASLRRPRLEPEIVPEPPVAMKRGGAFPLVMRFSMVVVFAAIVAYGLTMLAASQPGLPWLKGAGDRVAAIAPQVPQAQPLAPSPSRLVVEDQQVFANQPLSLAVSIAHARDDEALLFGGLAQGTTLSAGASTSPSTWRLPYDKLRGLYLYAPKDFVGVMNTSVDLIGPGKRLLDSRTMQLKWIARHREPAAPPALATATASAETTGGDHIGAVKLVTPGVDPIDPGEADILMQKGREFLTNGDISAARVAFRRLADAGVADAALALASTYDPDYLSAHGFLGVQGDRATARALYQRAKELGSAEANRILARMGN